eukprot:8974411-Heterocapsa_arctica.AAC.1
MNCDNHLEAMEVDNIIFKKYARKAYEDFVKETDASILIKSEKIINNSAEKFEAESELMETQNYEMYRTTCGTTSR